MLDSYVEAVLCQLCQHAPKCQIDNYLLSQMSVTARNHRSIFKRLLLRNVCTWYKFMYHIIDRELMNSSWCHYEKSCITCTSSENRFKIFYIKRELQLMFYGLTDARVEDSENVSR